MRLLLLNLGLLAFIPFMSLSSLSVSSAGLRVGPALDRLPLARGIGGRGRPHEIPDSRNRPRRDGRERLPRRECRRGGMVLHDAP